MGSILGHRWFDLLLNIISVYMIAAETIKIAKLNSIVTGYPAGFV